MCLRIHVLKHVLLNAGKFVRLKLKFKLSFNKTAGRISNALTKAIKILLPFATTYMYLTSDVDDEGPTTTKKGKLLSIANLIMSRT